MAGEWIKMRTGLERDPRVVAIAEALLADPRYREWAGYDHVTRDVTRCATEAQRVVTSAQRRVTRCVTVAQLLLVWGVANEVGDVSGDDLVMPETTLNRLDDVCEVPGFGAALASVGWAIEDRDNRLVRLPNFLRHNAPYANGARSSAADRQRRYRERKRAVRDANSGAMRDAMSDVTRDVTEAQRVASRVTQSRAEQSRVEHANAHAHAQDKNIDLDLDEGVGSTDSESGATHNGHAGLGSQEAQRRLLRALKRLGETSIEPNGKKAGAIALNDLSRSGRDPLGILNGILDRADADRKGAGWVLNALRAEARKQPAMALDITTASGTLRT